MEITQATTRLFEGIKGKWRGYNWRRDIKLRGTLLHFYSAKCRIAIIIAHSPTATETNLLKIEDWKNKGYHLLIFSTTQIENEIFKVIKKISDCKPYPVEKYFEPNEAAWKNKFGLPLK
jgi:very-short-patch-repair endonuclease